MSSPNHPRPVDDVLDPALAKVLGSGGLTLTGRLVQASNATFLARIETATGDRSCVYKPVVGERPLWDFPDGTLGRREVAAYVVSRVGGFDCVPVTVLGDGPLGPGSIQAWVEEDEDASRELVTVVAADAAPAPGWFPVVEGVDAADRPVAVVHADVAALRMLAVLDVVINNADRKGGHILGRSGRVFGVDHGVCFHSDYKLRTLLWGWAGRPLEERERAAVAKARSEAPAVLEALLAAEEIDAFGVRADALLREGLLPSPRGEWPAIPWPPF